jgi:hypothetical protein
MIIDNIGEKLMTPPGREGGDAGSERSFAAAADLRRRSQSLEFETDVDTLGTMLIFCGAGLLLSLVLLSYGIDLSPSVF